jgi:fructokinase
MTQTANPIVLGIGEVLWDVLPEGRRLGGAPANFALHAQALGAQAALISRVGRDPLGEEILRGLTGQGLSTALVQTDDTAPTGTVTVELSGKGIPSYTIHEHVAWDRIVTTPEALAAASQASAVCFGSLAQRSEVSREAIGALVSQTQENALRVFDINLRQHFYSPEIIERSLTLANVFKLSDGELPELAKLFGLNGGVHEQLEALARRFTLKTLALTCGAEGSLLWRGGQWSERPSPQVEVKDTVGAGDSFTATLVMGLLHGMDLDEINDRANAVAAYVCSKEGATPPLPPALRKPFSSPAG